MGAADTFITWRLIRPIADTGWVSVWCRNAWTDYDGLASCALLSWWPTTISAVLNSGSAPAGRIFPGRCQWELMFRGHIGSVEKVLVLSVVMYKWGGHERSWTCAVCPCGVGSEPGSCACLQSSFFSAAFHSAAVVSDFMFDALRGLDVSRGGSSSGRAW